MPNLATWLKTVEYRSKFPVVLTTLERVKQNIETELTTDDTELIRFIRDASDLFMIATGRTFVPYLDTQTIDWQAAHVVSLDDDLLSVTSITDSTGTLAGGDYRLRPNNSSPSHQIQTLGSRSFTYGIDYAAAITIVGLWGYHRNPAAMWKAMTTITAAIVSTTATTLTVTSITGLQTLDYLKLDDEVMLITAIVTTTAPTVYTLTVERGALGTTAATHLNNAAVSIYQQANDISEAVAAIAAFLYDTRDNFGTTYASAEGAMEVSKNLPAWVAETIDHYRVGWLR